MSAVLDWIRARPWLVLLLVLVTSGLALPLLFRRRGRGEVDRYDAAVREADAVRDRADQVAHDAAEGARDAVTARREREQEEIAERRAEDAAAVATERARTDAVLEHGDGEDLARRNREIVERLHRLREGP